jgi:uncharacterized coiled-coil protein SlyX
MKHDKDGALEARIEHLERALGLQTRLIDHLARALLGQQAALVELGRLAGVELRQESAQAAPLRAVN